jgi:hypothetical protein
MNFSTLFQNAMVQILLLWLAVVVIEICLWKAVQANERWASQDDALDEDIERNLMRVGMVFAFFVALVLTALIITDPKHQKTFSKHSPDIRQMGFLF